MRQRKKADFGNVDLMVHQICFEENVSASLPIEGDTQFGMSYALLG